MLERRASAVTRGARSLHRRRDRSRRGRAGPRRRRQHADRSRRRHRHDRRRALPADGGRRDRRAGRPPDPRRARSSRPTSRTSRCASVLNEITPGDFPKKTLLANSGAEAVENAIKIARAYTKRPGDAVLRGRLSRPHAADAEPHEQVRPVQARASGRSRRRSTGSPRPISIAGPTGMTEDDYVDVVLHRPRARAGRADRSGRARRDHHRAGAGRGRLHPDAAIASCAGSASCARSTAS